MKNSIVKTILIQYYKKIKKNNQKITKPNRQIKIIDKILYLEKYFFPLKTIT